MKKRILITAIGSSAARVLITELKKNGYYVVGCDINEKEYLYEASLVDSFVKIPYYNDKNYLGTLEKVIEFYDIDCVLPLTDPEVDIINKNRNRLRKVDLWMVLEHTVELARDKSNLAEFMRNHFPKNYIATVSEMKNISSLQFPVIAKPKNGRSSQGIEIIDNYESFTKKQYLFDENYLFQTIISGSVYTVDILRDKWGNTVCLPRIEVIRNTSGLGLSVKIVSDDKLIELCTKIASAINLYGCINMEFIKHEDEFYLIEINPRCSGGIGFSQKSGYDFVGNLSECYGGNEIDNSWEIEEMIIVKNYLEFVTK